jgi:hypothetical protein
MSITSTEIEQDHAHAMISAAPEARPCVLRRRPMDRCQTRHRSPSEAAAASWRDVVKTASHHPTEDLPQ